MTDVFINYRAADEPLAAVLIEKTLTARFGPGQVFLDTKSIELGRHFPPEIWDALRSCRVFLAVIGGRWLQPDEDGLRRIDDKRDYVRREIAEALRRDINVIPVLVGGAALPAEDVLPDNISGLSSRQRAELRVRGADYDVERLADQLEHMIGRAGRRPPGSDRRTGDDRALWPTTQYNFYDRVKANHLGNFYGSGTSFDG